MFPGIAERMQKELTALAPSGMKVNYHRFIHSMNVDYRMADRSRSLLRLSENILSGLVDLFWLLSPLSRIFGSLKRSTMSPALELFTVVSFFHLRLRFLIDSCHRMLLIFVHVPEVGKWNGLTVHCLAAFSFK